MKEFFIGLQFLTRLSFVRQTVWSEKDFGESVKFFPAVGAVVGIFLSAATGALFFLTAGKIPLFVGAFAFVLNIILTGGIHCDGLMDSADGLFSGREKEKMLEIMKDSRAGAFGVTALILLAALEISALAELAKISAVWLCATLYSAPIIGRLMMVFVIKKFPYARPNGMGKSFAKFTTQKTLFLAAAKTILLLVPVFLLSVHLALAAIISLVINLLIVFYFGKFSTKKLGGVTGDIYGAAEFLSEVFVVICFLFTKIIYEI